MQRYRYRFLPGRVLQVQVERPGKTIDAGLARAIRIPSSQGVVAGGTDAGGHGGPDGVRREVVLCRDGGEGRFLPGEEGREVLYQEQGPDGVDAEGVEAVLGVDLGGGLLGM